MGDRAITEAVLPEILKTLTTEELIFAIQLLRLAQENNCDLRGVVSAIKIRQKKNERKSAYDQRHKAERSIYNAIYMRARRAKKEEQERNAQETNVDPIGIAGQ